MLGLARIVEARRLISILFRDWVRERGVRDMDMVLVLGKEEVEGMVGLGGGGGGGIV